MAQGVRHDEGRSAHQGRPAGEAEVQPAEDLPRDPIVAAAAGWAERGWGSGPQLLAARSILRAEAVIRGANDRVLRPHGLTHARHEALALLYFSRAGALPLGALSRRLMIHPTSVTSTIDTLERLGFVERRSHPTDRRTTLGCITARGRAAMEATCREMAEARSGIAALSGAQAATTTIALLPLRAAAGDVVGAVGRSPGSSTPWARTADPIRSAAANWVRHGWPAGPHFVAALSILRAEELIRGCADEALRPHGLTVARHQALEVIAFAPEGSSAMGALSHQLAVHPTTVTTTVDGLERLGLVARVPHRRDRRTTLACITPTGWAVLERASRDMARSRWGLEPLGDGEAMTLFTTLRTLRAAAGDLGPEAAPTATLSAATG